MALGELVDESLAVQLLAVRLGEVSLSGFVLDGFPRSGPQVETLDAMLAHLGVSLDAAVHLSLDEKVARNRIADRLVCSLCKNSTSRLVVAAGSRCPSAPCRGMVSPRADDQDEAAINMRLSEFRELTRPVIDKYRAAGRLIEIDASREEVAVYAELRSRLSAIAATA
jgi:adenylate kinase